MIRVDPIIEDLLAHTAAPGPARDDLVSRMSGPGRHYHALPHLGDLWTRHLYYAPAAGFDAPRIRRLIGSAIAFHDAVYVPGATDNEAQSATLWRSVAGPDLSAAEIEWVAGTIECTADHLAAVDAPCPGQPAGLRLWLIDLDLTPLGDTPERFAANGALLRAEDLAAHPEDPDAARLTFLRSVLSAPRIFRTPTLAAAFEATARRNLIGMLEASSHQ